MIIINILYKETHFLCSCWSGFYISLHRLKKIENEFIWSQCVPTSTFQSLHFHSLLGNGAYVVDLFYLTKEGLSVCVYAEWGRDAEGNKTFHRSSSFYGCGRKRVGGEGGDHSGLRRFFVGNETRNYKEFSSSPLTNLWRSSALPFYFFFPLRSFVCVCVWALLKEKEARTVVFV